MRYRMRYGWIAVVAALVAASCSRDDGDRAQWIERGAAYVAPFKAEMKSALMEGLRDGPVSAIRTCQIHAPGITASARSDEIEIGRTSEKLRNPENAPDPWLQNLLDDYRAHPENNAPRVVALGPDRIGYVEPIRVQPLCVTCHGDRLAPVIDSVLTALYPGDAAVGYQTGDFRGVFWVTFPRLPTEF